MRDSSRTTGVYPAITATVPIAAQAATGETGPRATEPRHPKLKKCGLLDERMRMLAIFKLRCSERGITHRVLVEVTGLSLSRVHAVLSGDAPLPAEWVSALNDRDASDIFARFLAHTVSRRSA